MEAKINKSNAIKWFITFLVPIIVWLIPTNEIFTSDLRLFLVITIFVILMVAFEFFNLFITALLLPLLYIMTGLSTFEVAFSGFASSTAIIVFGSLWFANLLDSSGLLKRVAYWCILRTGGSYLGVLYGVIFAGFALTLMTSGNGIYIVATLCYGICRAFNLGVSKESALIMLCGAFASTTVRACVYTPGLMAIAIGGMQSVDPGLNITWAQYLFHNWPYFIMILLLPIVLCKIFKPKSNIENSKEYFKERYAELGKVTSHEKKAALLTALLLLFLFTQSLHHIDMAIGFCIAPMLFYLPGINVGTTEDIKNIDFSMGFFIVACLSIGAVATSLGFGELITETLSPVMQNVGSQFTLVAVWVFGVVANFLLTPIAILAAFSAPVTQLAIDLGINPIGMIYTLINTLDQIVLPYEYVNYLFFFAFGVISMKDFFKIMSVKLIFGVLFLVLLIVPWWHFVGVI